MTTGDLFGDTQPSKPAPIGKTKSAARPNFSWFFALRPSPEDAQRILSAADALLEANGIAGSRVTAERLHVTLDWIGDDIDEEVVRRACEAADTIQFPAMDASFDFVRTFSGPRGACVLLGDQGLLDVHKLRGEFVSALRNQGFRPPRSYEPHMTLCYDRRHRLAPMRIAPVTFRASEFTLVKSHLGLSRHELSRRWPLTG